MSPAEILPATAADPSPQVIERPITSTFENPPTVLRDPAYASVVEQIRGLATLPKGWDSYGAVRIQEEARTNAIRFVTMLATHSDVPVLAPTVGPSAEGGVTLRWQLCNTEVVVKLLARGGEYYVARTGEDQLVTEGDVGRLEGLVGRLREFLVR